MADKKQLKQQQTDIIPLQDSGEEIEIDILDLLNYYRSKLVWIIAAFLIGALVAGLVTFAFITPKYSATAKLYMVSASSESIVNLTDLNLGTSLSEDYEELLKSRPIFEDVIEELDLEYTYEEMLEMASVTTVEDTRILSVTITGPDPKEARKIANSLADKAVSSLPKLMDTSTPNVVEYAITPESKSSPSYTKNIMIGALLLTLLVLAILTFRHVTDDTLKDAEDVEAIFGIMPLTVIPEIHIEGFSDQGGHTERKKRKSRRRTQKKEVNR